MLERLEARGREQLARVRARRGARVGLAPLRDEAIRVFKAADQSVSERRVVRKVAVRLGLRRSGQRHALDRMYCAVVRRGGGALRGATILNDALTVIGGS